MRNSATASADAGGIRPCIQRPRLIAERTEAPVGSRNAARPSPPCRRHRAEQRKPQPEERAQQERGADYFQRRRNPGLTRLIGKPRGKVADTERGPVNLVGILNGRVSDERFDVSPRRLGQGITPGSVFPASPHRQVVGLLRQRARRVTDRRSPPDVHVPRPIAEPQPERAEGDRCKYAEKETGYDEAKLLAMRM